MPSRTRERGNQNVPTYVAGSSKYFYSNAPTETTNFNGSRIGKFETMTDVTTPQFKRRQAQGEIFNNPLSRQVYTYTANTPTLVFTESPPTNVAGKLRYRQEHVSALALVSFPLRAPVDPVQPTGHLLYNWVPLTDENSLMSRAATAALSDSSSKGAQGLVVVAEMRKTLNTLRNPLAATLKALRTRPKLGPKKDSSLVNQLTRSKETKAGYTVRKAGNVPVSEALHAAALGASSQYLTWFYGLRTIMFDIEEIVEALELPTFNRHTGRAFRSNEASSVTTSVWNAASPSNQATLTVTYHEIIEVRAGALALLEASTTAQRLGFDVRKIPDAAWEMTPWSFVVDWFLNIQDIIGALEAVLFNKFLAQWITRKRRLTWERKVSNHHVMPAASSWLTIAQPCLDEDLVVVEMLDRIPQNLSKLIEPRMNMSFNKVPTLAAISLVTQQLLKGR